MRVLVVTDRLSTRGGAEHYLLDLLRVLASQGHELRLLAGSVVGELQVPASVHVVRGLSRAVASRARLGALDAHLEWASRVVVQNVMNPVALAHIGQRKKAICIIQDHRVFCPALGKTLPEGQVCTEIMSGEACQTCLPDGDYRARTLDLTRSRLEAIREMSLVVLSQYMAQELSAVGQEQPEVIPPGISVLEPGDTEGERSGYILAGRLVRHKDPILAVSAWRASNTSQPLMVVGEGSQLDGIREAAEGAVGALKVRGWLERESLQRELGRARALLFPGFWQEPFGIVGLEALAMGTPVILSSDGGTFDWSAHGCIRVGSGDLNGMSQAILALDADPGRARALGSQGREHVMEAFSAGLFESRWARVLTA